MRDFRQIIWDDEVADDCRQLMRLAIREDLGRGHDLTTVALVEPEAQGEAHIVARAAGVVAGLKAAELALAEIDSTAKLTLSARDGDCVQAGQTVGRLSGSARTLLTAERTLLNFIGHLSGVATLTRRFVDSVAETKTRIYDTRKTTPGWRRLEKYAVRCGGGHNHRTGLFDAVLIKDNHLALGAMSSGQSSYLPAEAVTRARQFVTRFLSAEAASAALLEVEVDTLAQLQEVLPAKPDIVLLDNMSLDDLRRAVELRDAIASTVELEASGGVSLSTVAAIAATGVDRISAGALTHSAIWFDVALDWG